MVARILRFPFADSLVNFLSGLGTARDKGAAGQYTFAPLDRYTLEAAFRGDWIARKVVVAPAQDATRQWRSWQADKEDVTAIEKLERDLKIQQAVLRGLTLARLYGGALLVMGVEGTGEASSELNLERVGRDSLKFVRAVSKYDVASGELEDDMESPLYGRPKFYERTSRTGKQTRIHPSRVVRLVGAELPDETVATDAGQGWGDSALQAVDEAIRWAGGVAGGIAALVQEAKVDVVQVPNLAANLTTAEYANVMTKRWTYANQIKSITNMLLLDEKEKWNQISRSFAALPDVLKMYLLIASGAADIPATRMLGQSPAGLSATGESDVRNYYDRVKSDQASTLTPTMETLDEVILRSALGSRPDEIFYEWNPLWQPTESEKADVWVKKAQVFSADVNAGLVRPEALKPARESQLIEDGVYPGFELILEEAPDELTPDKDPDLIEEKQQQQMEMERRESEARAKKSEAPPARRRVSDWNPSQPRHPRGSFEGGRWAGGGVTLTSSGSRAFDGEPRETRRKLTKSETGKLGERVVAEHLKQRGYRGLRPGSTDVNNFPVDIVHRGGLVEVKAGLVSNSRDAQKWRNTVGEPGPREKEWLRTARAEDKARLNSAKAEAIMRRKAQTLRDFERRTGRPMTAETYSLIIDPDRKIVDVHRFEGFKRTTRWRGEDARRAYVGSYKYADERR